MRLLGILVLASLSTGCVAKSKYTALESQLDKCQEKVSKQKEARNGGGTAAAWQADLKPLIDKGVLDVQDIDGRTTIGMKSEVLFPSGSAELSADGKATVSQLARILERQTDSNWQVEGHTDNQPVSGTYTSNWDLGAARAISVLQVMVSAGMDPTHLSAATFGEYAPVASNANEQGRAENRRIEVVLLPEVGTRRLQQHAQ